MNAKKNIPKLSFEIAKVEEYLDSLKRLILGYKYWNEKIFFVYPELKEKLDNSENKQEALYLFFKEQERKYSKYFKKIKNDFQDSWDKINDKVITALSEIHEIDLSCFNSFTARITLNPICPRYLSKYSFDIYFALAENNMKGLCLHELSHFFFFEKYKQIFSDYNKKDFESPALLWKLSEALPAVILADKKIQYVFEHEPRVYDEFYKIEINNIPLLDILKDFYNKRKSFQDFLVKGYDFFKEHEKEINKLLNRKP